MLQEIDSNSKRANICLRCFLWASVSDRLGRVPTDGRQRCSMCVHMRLAKMMEDAAAVEAVAGGPQKAGPHASEIGTLETAWRVLHAVLVSAAESQEVLRAELTGPAGRPCRTGGVERNG